MKSTTGKREKILPLKRRIVIEKSDRFHRLANDPQNELIRVRRRAEKRGTRVIDFTSPRSDLAAPDSMVSVGAAETCRMLAQLFKDRRGITVDPETEILPLPHVEEGFRLITLSFVNSGDVVLLPDPADQAYRAATILAGGWPVTVPLLKTGGYLPDLGRIEPEASRRTQILFISYPNRPTGAVGPADFYESLVQYSRTMNVPVAHDATLSACWPDDSVPPGLLNHPEGREVGVEFHELAPLHNLDGWRPGYVVGNREIIFAMKMLLNHIGSPGHEGEGVAFRRALALDAEARAAAIATFARRRTVVCDGLREIHWYTRDPGAGTSLWIRTPRQLQSMRFASMLIRRVGIGVIPGVAFGEFGHDYVAIHLTQDETAIRVALDRLYHKLPRRWRRDAGIGFPGDDEE